MRQQSLKIRILQGFAGLDYSTGARDSGPVQFERDQEADPFGLDSIIDEVKGGGKKNALDAIGRGGAMAAGACLVLDLCVHGYMVLRRGSTPFHDTQQPSFTSNIPGGGGGGGIALAVLSMLTAGDVEVIGDNVCTSLENAINMKYQIGGARRRRRALRGPCGRLWAVPHGLHQGPRVTAGSGRPHLVPCMCVSCLTALSTGPLCCCSSEVSEGLCNIYRTYIHPPSTSHTSTSYKFVRQSS